MRFLMLLISVLMVACLVSATPVTRIIKSGVPGVKGLPTRTHQKPETELRKGEYVCNGEICRLEPGKPPAGCEECQYPVKMFRNNN